jgi:hypothetical protein
MWVGNQKVNVTSVTEDLSTALNIYCTGTGVANNDVVQRGLSIKWFRGI